MFERIPIRRRYLILLCLLGFGLVLEGIYAVQTLGIYSSIREIESRQPEILDAPSFIRKYEKNLATLDHEIQSLRNRSVNIESHAEFVSYTEALCDSFGLRLFALPVETRTQVQDYTLATISFSVEGNFRDILQFIYRMEQSDRVASVEYMNATAETVRINEEKREVLITQLKVNRLLAGQKIN